MSCPRPLADAESSRLASAVRVIRLLSTIGFSALPVNSLCRRLLLGGLVAVPPLLPPVNSGPLVGWPLRVSIIVPLNYGLCCSEVSTIWIACGPVVSSLPCFGPPCMPRPCGPSSLARRLLLCTAGCSTGDGSWFVLLFGLMRWGSVFWILLGGSLLRYLLVLLVVLGITFALGGVVGRLGVGAVRRVTNLALCLILSPSSLGSIGPRLVSGLLVVPLRPLCAWVLPFRRLTSVRGIRLRLAVFGRAALFLLLVSTTCFGNVRVASILRSSLPGLRSLLFLLALGGTVARMLTWSLLCVPGFAVSKIACGTPVSLGVLLTLLSSPVGLFVCPF